MKKLETILVDITEGIATITLNRPAAMNAINHTLMKEVGYLFSEGLPVAELQGVIITGAGDKAFIAGADIKEFTGLSAQGGTEKSSYGHDVFNSIERYSVPVLAAINGYSLGGGNELAMACHIRICSENAMFGQPEVKLGLIPGYGGTQRLIQYLGKGRAMELLLTADMIDATKALEYGLVTHVTSQEELMNVARKIITKIGSRGPDAVAKTIETVNAYFDKKSDGFGMEMDYFGKAMASDQTAEGVNAFIEKRKPNFRK